MAKIADCVKAVSQSDATGWLVVDFRGSNPILASILGYEPAFTRRAVLSIDGKKATLLTHRVDAGQVRSDLDVQHADYVSWQEYEEWLRAFCNDHSTVMLDTSDGFHLPIASVIDAASYRIVESFKTSRVVSSANIWQQLVASWSKKGLSLHREAMDHATEVMALAFSFIAGRLRDAQPCNELEVQRLILKQFADRGLETEDLPVVAANKNSGDPHYEPSPEKYSAISRGDWVMIDLWCKIAHPEAPFADITWMASATDKASIDPKKRAVFDLVAGARDEAVRVLRSRVGEGKEVRGYELDRAARTVISDAGYGDYFVHRTGHSLSPGPSVHGRGANLDDLESQDKRLLLPRTGFTIEPGIYMDDFGVRSEINVYLDSNMDAEVTSPVQPELIALLDDDYASMIASLDSKSR